ncbi:threonine--tRNA ligase [candidate division FCPU426 bacterium]|nr:threonine--tRNA ligase [candidate division FCPU426 bacterium]
MSSYWMGLSENNKIDVAPGTSFGQALKELNPALYGKALAVKTGDKLWDLSAAVPEGGCIISVVDFSSPEGQEIFRHSTAHLMAAAVKKLFPETKVAIGPAIKDGFYYDFDRDTHFTPDDLAKIEEQMQELARQKLPFERKNLSKQEAHDLFAGLQESYKLELLDAIADPSVSIYSLDGFVDLCRGPHLPHAGAIKSFKLLSIAGAYWRGDEKNKMLQRIYGTSFDKASALEQHLQRLEEARRRDHRRLGKELDLFSLHEDSGAGLVYWHPKGAMIRKVMEDFWRNEHLQNGYELLYTPHIGKAQLWETSGHLVNYNEYMYAPMQIDEQDYYLKPMNCPFHIKIYKSSVRSYRQMPLRWAELGTVYRYEKSGVLHGLFRVRGFTQDDAHVFCTRAQLEGEIQEVLRFVLYILKTFGFSDYDIYLATKPEKGTVGQADVWEEATQALQHALETSGLTYAMDEGGGAFYGPKIDIKIRDSLERTWQCSTIQVDFNLPERFDMHYIGDDGREHRPIMIHRALMGSLERFFGIMVEHYGGAFPPWLAPVQARVLTIADRHQAYAADIVKQMRSRGLRVDADLRSEKINAKVRDAQLEKIPYMLVVGDKEVENRNASLRLRTGENRGPLAIEEIAGIMLQHCQDKSAEL